MYNDNYKKHSGKIGKKRFSAFCVWFQRLWGDLTARSMPMITAGTATSLKDRSNGYAARRIYRLHQVGLSLGPLFTHLLTYNKKPSCR